nr:hypothetical protein BaRGS_029267 [Batillaria attramentaria]
MYVDRHEDVNEDDVMTLKQELITVFIDTLQQDSRSAWSYLCEVLQLLEGYREYLDYFETRAEFNHYLERIMYHLHLHQERLFDLQVEQYLQRVFPELGLFEIPVAVMTPQQRKPRSEEEIVNADTLTIDRETTISIVLTPTLNLTPAHYHAQTI